MPSPSRSSPPPDQLLDVAAKVDARLNRLLTVEAARWSAVDPRLAEAIDELHSVLRSGGKRLRAAFCYWAWYGAVESATAAANRPMNGPLGELDESLAIDAGAAFELLQAFALIHDDIMDDSATRRGRPTIHTKQAQRLVDHDWQGEPRRFGEGVAILIGDLGHAYADGLTAQVPPAARQVWDELRIELNLGQYLDLRSAAATELDPETAQRVSTFKSGLYTIVRPLQFGASLHGPASDDLLDALDRYGRPLGRAFQLKDDLLGVLGDESTIGKPVGDDLREGKPTELVSLAVDRASPTQRRLLTKIGQRDLSVDDVAAIVDVFGSTGAIDDIAERISGLVTRSVDAIGDLPFDDLAKKALEALADYVAARNS